MWRTSLIFYIFFEMCEVWPASPVPWASYGYLCVKIQCRCVKCGTFVPSDLIWQSWEKMVVTKQCWFVQMWTVPREPFCARASLISQLRVTVEPEVTPHCPCTEIHPFRGIACTQCKGNKVQYRIVLTCYHSCLMASCISKWTAFKMRRTCQNQIERCDSNK